MDDILAMLTLFICSIVSFGRSCHFPPPPHCIVECVQNIVSFSLIHFTKNYKVISVCVAFLRGKSFMHVRKENIIYINDDDYADDSTMMLMMEEEL